ncbi:MAG: sulfatase family protein [Saccharospirillum sp.]
MKKPNYILFMTDQQRADHLGCYGNAEIRTPNIDQLASNGIRFKRFYVNTPICQPNRASLFSGLMPSVNGVRQNGIPLGLDTQTVADVLKAQGYRTGYIGKAHFQNVTAIPAPKRRLAGQGTAPADHDSNSLTQQRTGEQYQCEVRSRWAQNPHREFPASYYGFDHVRLCIGHGDLVDGHYTAWLGERHPDPGSLRGPDNALADDRPDCPQCWRTAVPESLYPTTYVKEAAIDFLQQQDESQPFLLVVSFPDPHHPFTPPGRYWSMYDPDDLTLPASYHHSVYNIAGLGPEALTAYRWGDADPNSHWPFRVNEAQARKMLALNYGAISMVDDAVGEVMAALNESGQADNTVVAFTSDHGDYMGDHGTVLKMGLHFQSVIRVPFILCDPQRPGDAGRCDAELGSAIDLMPTLLQRAGIQVPVGVQGQNLFSRERACVPVLIEDPGIEVFEDSDASHSLVTLVTRNWRLTVFEGRSYGELYDLVTDPHECHNLWDDPGYGATRHSLQQALMQRLLALRDKRLVATARA